MSHYETINLVLSHYHLDHTIGLIYLAPLVRDKRLRVYGPGLLAYDLSTETYLNELLREEFFSRRLIDFSADVRCIDFPSEAFTIGFTQVMVSQQLHSAPSFRIVLDDLLVYATDTVCLKGDWEDMHAKLLLHECWEIYGIEDSRHTTLWQIENHIPRDNFEKIALVHQNPAWSRDDMKRLKSRLKDTNIRLAADGMVFDL